MDGTRVSVRPLWVRMQGENRPFSAGTTYEISCEVVGARPTPKITWSKGSMILRNARQTVRSTEFQVTRHSENNCSEKSRMKRKTQYISAPFFLNFRERFWKTREFFYSVRSKFPLYLFSEKKIDETFDEVEFEALAI